MNTIFVLLRNKFSWHHGSDKLVRECVSYKYLVFVAHSTTFQWFTGMRRFGILYFSWLSLCKILSFILTPVLERFIRDLRNFSIFQGHKSICYGDGTRKVLLGSTWECPYTMKNRSIMFRDIYFKVRWGISTNPDDTYTIVLLTLCTSDV